MIKSNLKAEALIKTSCIYADSDQSREHEASTALPLSLNSGDRLQRGEIWICKQLFFLKKCSLKFLLYSLTYSQFTSGLSTINHERSSPPHHYPSRNLQRSSATSVLLCHRGVIRDLTHLTDVGCRTIAQRRGYSAEEARVAQLEKYFQNTRQYNNSRVLFH